MNKRMNQMLRSKRLFFSLLSVNSQIFVAVEGVVMRERNLIAFSGLGGTRVYLNLESTIPLNPSCYYTFGAVTL